MRVLPCRIKHREYCIQAFCTADNVFKRLATYSTHVSMATESGSKIVLFMTRMYVLRVECIYSRHMHLYVCLYVSISVFLYFLRIYVCLYVCVCLYPSMRVEYTYTVYVFGIKVKHNYIYLVRKRLCKSVYFSLPCTETHSADLYILIPLITMI